MSEKNGLYIFTEQIVRLYITRYCSVFIDQCCGAGAATFRVAPEPKVRAAFLKRLRLHFFGKQKRKALFLR